MGGTPPKKKPPSPACGRYSSQEGEEQGEKQGRNGGRKQTVFEFVSSPLGEVAVARPLTEGAIGRVGLFGSYALAHSVASSRAAVE